MSDLTINIPRRKKHIKGDSFSQQHYNKLMPLKSQIKGKDHKPNNLKEQQEAKDRVDLIKSTHIN